MVNFSISYSKIRQFLAYAIGAFMLFFVSKIWINDYVHLSFNRVLVPIISIFIAKLIDKYTTKSLSNQMLNIMIVGGIIMLLMYLINRKDGIMIASILVNILQGLILYHFYKTFNSTENNPNALRFILIMMSMMILHVQMFPENWKSCGTFRRRLCYEPTL